MLTKHDSLFKNIYSVCPLPHESKGICEISLCRCVTKNGIIPAHMKYVIFRSIVLSININA
jgi:hypothetical protein